MATIATCPQCAAQLALPESFAAGSWGQCPKCDAEFSLDDAIQVSLPTVRILEAPNAPAAATVGQPDFGSGILDETDTRKTLADWEERLKKAINAGTSDATVAPEPLAATTADAPTEFDFDVDLDAPRSAETPQTPTLSDDSQPSAATVDIAADATVDETSPVVEEPADEDIEPTLPSAPMLDLGEPTAADLAMPAVDDAPTLSLDTSPRRPVKRRLLPKLVAALLFGPLLGGALGLYGLLWIKGPSADFLGLAQYLPPTLLPPSMLPPLMLDSDDAQPAATVASPSVRVDDQLQPATAEQEVVDLPALSSITLAEFTSLVTAATAAAPELMSGDLRTRESRTRIGRAYMALCRLAEELEFVTKHADIPMAQDQIAAATNVYRRITGSGANLADLAQIATLWWEHPGRSSSGIFFAGEIRAARPIGAGTLCQIVLDEPLAERPITVLLPRMTYRIGDRVGVVGAVVANPQSEIPGYDSLESQVVVAYDSYSLQ